MLCLSLMCMTLFIPNLNALSTQVLARCLFFASLYFMFSYYNIHLWNLHDCSSLAYALNFFPFVYYSATSCWTIAFCHTSLSTMINLFYLFYLHWNGRFQAIHWVYVVNWIHRRWTIITKLLQEKKNSLTRILSWIRKCMFQNKNLKQLLINRNLIHYNVKK